MNLYIHVVNTTYHHGLEISRTHCIHRLIVDLHNPVPDFEQPLTVDDAIMEDAGYDQVIADQLQSDALREGGGGE